MQRWRRLHLYLGCLFAPALLFFAITGSWQLFNWHEGTKAAQRGKSYTPPAALAALSYIHKEGHVPGTPARAPTPLRYFMAAAAVGLVVSTLLGLVMAYRFSRQPWVPTICLASGILIPGVLLWIYK